MRWELQNLAMGQSPVLLYPTTVEREQKFVRYGIERILPRHRDMIDSFGGDGTSDMSNQFFYQTQ